MLPEAKQQWPERSCLQQAALRILPGHRIEYVACISVTGLDAARTECAVWMSVSGLKIALTLRTLPGCL